jgi:hypothetical protein
MERTSYQPQVKLGLLCIVSFKIKYLAFDLQSAILLLVASHIWAPSYVQQAILNS